MSSLISFLRSEDLLAPPVEGEYNMLLVVAAALVACLTSYVGFMISERVAFSTSLRNRHAWLLAGALSLGGGVWAMHFIAMLAFSLPFEVSYDPLITLVSMVPAILASLVIINAHQEEKPGFNGILFRGVLMGVGIGAMHYIGMAAMQLDAAMRYDPWVFALSVVVAVALSMISLYLKIWLFEEEHREKWLILAGIAMGAAISAMHYTGMAAVYFYPLEEFAVSREVEGVNGQLLTFLITLFVGGVLLMMIMVVQVSRRLDLLGRLELEVEQRKVMLNIMGENEERFRSIINSTGEAIISLDSDGQICLFNPAAERMFGRESAEVLGMPVQQLFTGFPYSDFASYDLKSGESRESELVAVSDKGGEILLDASLSAMSLQGRPGIVMAMRDVTQRKQVERLKDEFVSTVSHELRTPLTAIRGSLGLIIDGGLLGEVSVRVESLLDIARSNTSRLLLMINDILDFQKIEKGDRPLVFSRINIMDVVNGAIAGYERRAEEQGIDIHLVETLPYDGYVFADAEQLQAALEKLLSNAVRYSPNDSEIGIGVTRVGEMLRVMVSDQGPGVPEEFREHLFEHFSQFDSSDTRMPGGAGLGLAIARAVTEKHGGDIGLVDRERDGGACFYIDIPEMGLDVPVQGEDADNEVPDLSRTRVLTIEDDLGIAEVIRALLIDDATVVQASSLEMARDYLQAETWQLVLLDVNLPDGSGLDLLQMLHRIKPRPPILVFSSSDIPDSMREQVDAVMIKSQVSNEQLVTMIRTFLEMAA